MKESQVKNRILEDVIRLTWYILTFGIILISILSRLLPDINYFIDLFSHFQLQYFITLMLLLTLGLLIPQLDKRLLIPVIIYQIVLAIAIFPMKISPAENELITDSDIFFINANYYNNGDDISEYIRSLNINTVAIVETNENIISDLTKTYGEPRSIEGYGGKTCVIFSKEPVFDYLIDQNNFTYPVCTTVLNDTVLVVVHPYPPFGNNNYFAQIDHFNEVSTLLEQIEEDGYNFILMGDFNSTIYSPIFRREFSGIFKQNNYTWSAAFPLALPIDHAMSNISIHVSPSKILSSDHSGLFIDIQ